MHDLHLQSTTHTTPLSSLPHTPLFLSPSPIDIILQKIETDSAGMLREDDRHILEAYLAIINLINQQMSDEEVAFDDWEAEAEAVVEQVKNEPPPSAETEPAKAEQSEEAPKQKQEVVDPRQALLARIASYGALEGEKFEDYLEQTKASSNNSEVKSSNQILKNDKDFAQFARSVGRRLNEQATEEDADVLEESNVFRFVDELVLLLYGQTEWKNLEEVKSKLKIVKRERKDEEVKARKKQEKEERERKLLKAEQEEATAKKEKEDNAAKVEQPQQDLFDGATFVNSKQIDDERKNKEKVKVEAPKPAEDDDDDFM